MVDVTEDFLVKAKTYLGEEGKRVRNYFCCGLQDFSPEPNSYDVIWIQWVIGEHLLRVPVSCSLQLWRRGLPRGPGASAPAAGGPVGPPSPPVKGTSSMIWSNSVPTATHCGGHFVEKM